MVVNKSSKSRKRRGSRTHGWGRMHRGAGDRGGVGKAGSGKKADCKKPSSDKILDYFGKKGFTSRGRSSNRDVTINVKDVLKRAAWFKQKGFAKEEGDLFECDLSKAGFDKLLGTGKVTRKVKITVSTCSASVRKAVEDAGGSVVTK